MENFPWLSRQPIPVLSEGRWHYPVNSDLFNHTLFYEPRNLSPEAYRRMAEYLCQDEEEEEEK